MDSPSRFHCVFASRRLITQPRIIRRERALPIFSLSLSLSSVGVSSQLWGDNLDAPGGEVDRGERVLVALYIANIAAERKERSPDVWGNWGVGCVHARDRN